MNNYEKIGRIVLTFCKEHFFHEITLNRIQLFLELYDYSDETAMVLIDALSVAQKAKERMEKNRKEVGK